MRPPVSQIILQQMRSEGSEPMEFQIEEYVKHTIYPYEHPFDDAWTIELGCGGYWYYIYKDYLPFLKVQVPTQPPFCTGAIILHDNLIIGSNDYGIYKINLKDIKNQTDFRIKHIETDDSFRSFAVDRDVFYMLGMHRVSAFDSDLHLLWKSQYLSADGVCFKSIEGDIMTVECCLEPWSEDWFDAKISSLDGSIIYTPIEFHE